MSILVTGGAGFIGSHLIERLLDEGHTVIAIDNFDPFYNSSIKERNLTKARTHPAFVFEPLNILDKNGIERLFQTQTIETVVHLAAKAGVRPSILDPSGYYQTNVQGTLNLLECCREQKINRFIFASSSSVYGNNRKVPFSETDPVDHPISPYAATKKAAELLCHTFYHLYKINIYALRFFTVYGPRQRPDLAIHKFFRLIYNNESIPIYGNGSTSRDYTYIDDILDGIIAGIERVKGYEIINIGESQPVSLSELVQSIEKVSGKQAKKNFLPMQAGDVLKTHADTSKAKKLLNYQPTMPLSEGLKIFKEWFEDNSDLTIQT
jgi:UDP-glucuronate 4-epimerase